MLKQATFAILFAGMSISAQPVISGMGHSPADYAAIWGAPFRSGDGPFETKEQVWVVKRKATFTSQEFEVHVLFRTNRSMEERWVRPGKEAWEKEELWKVLDGKGVHFELLKQGAQLVSPYQVLQSPNTVINFSPTKGEMAAQLQNTLQGPQIRISSREWAQTKLDMGISGQQDLGRLATNNGQGRVRPLWGGKSFSALTANLKEQPAKPGIRSWATRNGRGTITLTTKKSTRLEWMINEPTASVEANRVLQSSEPNATLLKDALRESFRKFYALSTQSAMVLPCCS